MVPAGIEVAAQATGDERAAAAMALKERLVEYDRNSAQRTTVVDDQVQCRGSPRGKALTAASCSLVTLFCAIGQLMDV